MSWGTCYKYEGYLNRIGINEIDDKRDECKKYLQCDFDELLALIVMTPPTSGVIIMPDSEPEMWNDYALRRLTELREDIQEKDRLLECLEQAIESRHENLDNLSEG